jgi:hypothetical protein
MDQDPQRAVREPERGEGRDGLAAVAVTLLAAALIALLLIRII